MSRDSEPARPRGVLAAAAIVFVAIYVGLRFGVPWLSVLLGLSQVALADGLGISFQQLYKYETGFNRISAGQLYGCAELLNVRPEYFFEGLDGSDIGTPNEMRSVEAMKLARAYYSIDDPALRQHVRMLVRAIAASDR